LASLTEASTTQAMSKFSLERRTVIMSDCIGGRKTPTVIMDTKFVGEVEVFRATCRDPVLARLLTGQSTKKQRPLTGCDVFSAVASARDAAVEAIANPPAADDLGLEEQDEEDVRPGKRKRSKMSKEVPDLVTVTLPPVGNLPALTCKATASGPLYVNLHQDVLMYMAEYYTVHNTQPPDDAKSRHTYIFYDEDRKSYRVRFKGNQKWFPVSKFDDAKSAAESYLKELQA
jgi:hypothetical protein